MGVRFEDIARAARDGLATSLGLGVLVYQRAQVYRQELARTVSHVVADLGQRHQDPDRID
jgi:hypothetical protein